MPSRTLIRIAVAIALLVAPPAVADQALSDRLSALDVRVRQAPDDLDLRLQRAELRAAANLPIEALRDLEAVAAVRPDEPRLLLIRADLHLSLGSPDLALADLDRRIDQMPASARAHEARSRLRVEAGDPLGAAADAEAAWTLAPSVDRAIALARWLDHLDRRAEAADLCAAAADRLGGAVVLRLAAIERLRGLARHDAALDQVDRLLAASPDHPDWLELRADILAGAGHPAQARRVRQLALDRLDELLALRPTPMRRAARDRVARHLQESP